MNIPLLDEKQILENLNSKDNRFFEEYYVFYSSWFGGMIKNPRMMLLPMDEHMVHRGDGVFEAIKVVNRSVYLLEEHLNRLFRSAELIQLQPPLGMEAIKQIIFEALRVADRNEAIIRVFLSRGPGDFSVNPYDSVGAQLYVVISKLKQPKAEKFESGVVIGQSVIPVKDSWMAQVKSCNYLPNVMMKKEAIDRGLDYVIGIDDQGFISEGPTENILILDAHGILLHPALKNILKGTTMMRVAELAREIGIQFDARHILPKDLLSASEVIICGTSTGLLPVVKFEGQKIGNGKRGPVTQKLQDLLYNDIQNGPKRSIF